MKVMIIGGGGREHAIVKALTKSPKIEKLYALPGNGGIAMDAECVNIAATDIEGAVEFAKQNGIDFAVVAPDDPLVLGMVDALEAAGVSCFGPNKKAAIIEGSKVFSKDLMKKYNIPTAAYEVFDNARDALKYIETAPIPTVIKADGLALGKGVIIAETRAAAAEGVRSIMQDKVFGESGNKIVVEEFLSGPEVSVLAFTDGETIVPMISGMDHKRALDGDKGLNTGGMGVVAPNPYYTEDVAKQCMRAIFEPTVAAMRKEGRPFSGCLYFGLMLTQGGPKVIEYNCRFGDPEAQVVLPLLQSDLFDIMLKISEGKLAEADVRFAKKHACCVVMASGGYPKSYETGKKITIPAENMSSVYVAGALTDGENLVTSGGRVLGVTEMGETLSAAIENAYKTVEKVHFEGAFCRKDIGKKALGAIKK